MWFADIVSVAAVALLAGLYITPAAGSFNWDITTHGTVSGWRWEKPWPYDNSELMQFTELCRHAVTFPAQQYKFSDLDHTPPAGMSPWAEAVRALATGRVYPGSWDGVNVKGNERDILMVDWKEVPELARRWIENESSTEEDRNRHFFRVLRKPKALTGGRAGGPRPEDTVGLDEDVMALPDEEKVLVTAPGELYQFLPLWVAEGAKCKGKCSWASKQAFSDMSQYLASRAKDTCVVAWATDHSRVLLEEGKKAIKFTIEARLVKETEDGRAARIFWEQHHRELERQQRKINREERAASRKGIEKDREGSHDEL
ncbi:hypothetical protein GGTG_07477 [Gaeumannomyces tritici R3-111a-1]|uniref:Uncharacterized protein n=1 Tax=Gaeumannomyces tritici (strain R3-111a-1) TaxID=644352 RepID=J3P1S9_GAET3|nr:hypothetical protein GGTG_07477 [Gaeumannomyces tritici R3-111a-1]EJT73621.1 hypothetical protein GGTG_07477 [Gaeumannomyces tritici R3-111a-1]